MNYDLIDNIEIDGIDTNDYPDFSRRFYSLGRLRRRSNDRGAARGFKRGLQLCTRLRIYTSFLNDDTRNIRRTLTYFLRRLQNKTIQTRTIYSTGSMVEYLLDESIQYVCTFIYNDYEKYLFEPESEEDEQNTLQRCAAIL